MYQITDAHFLTVILVAAAMLFIPMYILAVYVFSGASAKTGLTTAAGFIVFGAGAVWFVLADASQLLGPFRALSVPVTWVLPSLILWWKRDWFLTAELSQKWLVGFQAFRVIGGVFLIEMLGGKLPPLFAMPAGIGDVLVGLIALTVLVAYANREKIPNFAVIMVIVLGLTDLAVAFTMAFTTSVGVGQLFFPDIVNDVRLFPVGMIPYFIVRYFCTSCRCSTIENSSAERPVIPGGPSAAGHAGSTSAETPH